MPHHNATAGAAASGINHRLSSTAATTTGASASNGKVACAWKTRSFAM